MHIYIYMGKYIKRGGGGPSSATPAIVIYYCTYVLHIYTIVYLCNTCNGIYI